jgi:hypothetical protein
MSKARPHLASADRTWLGPAAHSQARPHHIRPQVDRVGHSWPGLGSTAPIGTPAPTICHVSGPRHQQSHKHTLDGWDTPVNGRFGQKAKFGSTWIDVPTLNHHNRHSEAILDIPERRWCITRHRGGLASPRGPAAPIHPRAGRNRPKERTYNCVRSSDQGRPRREVVDH